MSGRPSPLHDRPRPYRLAVPLEVVPSIDALQAQGHKKRAISKALGIHENTIRAVLRRSGGYREVQR